MVCYGHGTIFLIYYLQICQANCVNRELKKEVHSALKCLVIWRGPSTYIGASVLIVVSNTRMSID